VIPLIAIPLIAAIPLMAVVPLMVIPLIIVPLTAVIPLIMVPLIVVTAVILQNSNCKHAILEPLGPMLVLIAIVATLVAIALSYS
jgi:hypothetical protein